MGCGDDPAEKEVADELEGEIVHINPSVWGRKNTAKQQNGGIKRCYYGSKH